MDESLALQDIFKVGTSAGGQRPKAIIAIKKGTNEPDVICSGQGDVPDGFRHAILKFQEHDYPSAELEMTYYEMDFSFLMNRKGQWSLAPAYDLTFSVDLEALPFENYHTFSANSKVSDINDKDMLEVAEHFDLKERDALKVIDEVRSSVRRFPEIAERNEVPKDWIEKIFSYLEQP